MKDAFPSQQIGIKQIAEALGISIGSVDRALHGRTGVSPATRDRVLKMAAKLDYKPNIAARNLKLNRHIRIGVFLPKQIESFFDPLRAGIRNTSRESTGANIEVTFHSYPHIGEGEIACLQKHNWQQFDGIIMVPGNPADLSEIAETADKKGKHIVFVATDAPRIPHLSTVAVEAATSGGIAAELLGQLLPRESSVVSITGDLHVQDHADKLRGFAAGLAVHSPHLTLLPAIESHESPDESHQAVLNLLKRHPQLGGIYISTANSIPVLRALKECGRLQKIKVIATDLFPELADLIESGSVFATLNQRPYTQGKLAFEILSHYFINGFAPRQKVRITPHIVIRSNLALMMDSLRQNVDKPTAPESRLFPSS